MKAYDDKPVYFLGTLMFTEGEKAKIEVADGQQRLATISMALDTGLRLDLALDQTKLAELIQWLKDLQEATQKATLPKPN